MYKKSIYDEMYKELLGLGHEEREASIFVLWKMGYDKGFKKGMYYGSFWITLLFLILRLVGVM